MHGIKTPVQRVINRLSIRNIIHRASSESKKNLEPVTIAYTKFESTDSVKVENQNKPSPLIVMHGLFGSRNNWTSVCKALRKDSHPTRKIISIDARNHGDSQHSSVHSYPALAADVANLLRQQRIEKATFMGHSMGGRTGMYLALKYPKLIEELIVVDISPVSNDEKFSKLSSYFSALMAVQIPPNIPLSVARSTVNSALITSIPDKRLRSFLLTNLIQLPNGTVKWRLNIRSLKENFHNIAKFPIEASSGISYEGPTTFITGENSDFVKESHMPAIKKLFPNFKLYSIPRAGHWVHNDKPNEFLQTVLQTINK